MLAKTRYDAPLLGSQAARWGLQEVVMKKLRRTQLQMDVPSFEKPLRIDRELLRHNPPSVRFLTQKGRRRELVHSRQAPA
jgi:hypothetical protein